MTDEEKAITALRIGYNRRLDDVARKKAVNLALHYIRTLEHQMYDEGRAKVKCNHEH